MNAELPTDFTGPSFPPTSFILRPPRGFRPAVGVACAKIVTNSPCSNLRSPGTSHAQKAGTRYEKRLVKAFLKEEPLLQCGQWIQYETARGSRFCQPDLLLETRDRMYIFEIKITHTVWAYWQLVQLYFPVVKALTSKPIVLVEVTRSFDPSVLFPLPMRLHFSYESLRTSPFRLESQQAVPEEIEVLQWKA